MERGYPKGGSTRIAELQRVSREYRGSLAATQWIYVKASRRGGYGYVDFEPPWTDGDAEAPAQFCMDEHGRVRCRGRIAGGTAGSIAWYMPPGFSSAIPQRFNLANGESGYAILEIGTDGAVTVVGIV